MQYIENKIEEKIKEENINMSNGIKLLYVKDNISKCFSELTDNNIAESPVIDEILNVCIFNIGGRKEYYDILSSTHIDYKRLCGTYVLSNIEKRYYVGSSRDVLNEIYQSKKRLKNVLNIDLTKVYVFMTSNYTIANLLERIIYNAIDKINGTEPAIIGTKTEINKIKKIDKIINKNLPKTEKNNVHRIRADQETITKLSSISIMSRKDRNFVINMAIEWWLQEYNNIIAKEELFVAINKLENYGFDIGSSRLIRLYINEDLWNDILNIQKSRKYKVERIISFIVKSYYIYFTEKTNE